VPMVEVVDRTILEASAKHLQEAASVPMVKVADRTLLEATAKHLQRAAPVSMVAYRVILEATAKHLGEAACVPIVEVADRNMLFRNCSVSLTLSIVLVRPGISLKEPGVVLLVVTGAISVNCDLCRLRSAASGRD
jgi:hypothetical protein